jgi:hypothetical protein
MELAGIEDIIESEIRIFTVKLDFKAIHKFIMLFNADSAEVARGAFVTVNLTFRNAGNMKETIILEALGELKGHVSKDNVVELEINEEKSITVKIFAESKLKLKTYNLTITASNSWVNTSASINVKVVEGETSVTRDNWLKSWMLYSIAVILFLVIIAILIFLVLRSKKKKEEESEVIEAEIEARPRGGITKADLDMLSISSGQATEVPFQGRLSYNLPAQKQAYQHKPLTQAPPQVTLPQLKVTGQLKEQSKALPQSTSIPPTPPVVSTPVPTVTLPQKAENTAKIPPAVPALPMTSTVPTAPMTPLKTVKSVPVQAEPVPIPPAPAAPPPEAPPMPSLASELFPKADGSDLPPPPDAAPPLSSTTISADSRKMKLSYISLKNASTFRIEEPMPCSICFGNISGGLQAARCSCGNISHLSCGIKIGKCPECGVDYQGMINTVSEEAIIRSVEDSQKTAKKEVEVTVDWDEKGDMMRGLLKQLLNKENSVEQYQQISKDIKESF